MKEISKSDWKLFNERLPLWQENYMERLINEYIDILNSQGDASERFWKLEDRIKIDRKNPGVILQKRKLEAVWDIAMLVGQKVITMKDLEGFSPELIEEVEVILNR